MDKSKLLNWLFFFSLFLLFLLPPTDPDLGWHLKCGEQIWQRQGLCSQNRFTVLLEDYTSPNHAWLYQAVLYPIFAISSLWGLTLFNALLMSLAFVFFYQAIKDFSLEKMLAIALTTFWGFGVFSFGIRSQLTSFLLFNLLFWLFSQIRKNPSWMYLLPLVMIVWANSHGSSLMGLVLLAFFLLDKMVKEPKHFLPPTLILIVSAAATLANPFGVKIHQEAWRHFAVVDLSKLIAEWVPPIGFVRVLILLGALALSPTLMVLSFSLLPFAFAALKARRNVPFYFALAFHLLLTICLRESEANCKEPRPKGRGDTTSPAIRERLNRYLRDKVLRQTLTGMVVAGFLLYGLFVRLPQTLNTNRSWQSYCQNSSLDYPCQAVEFLRAQSEKGNIFNRYEWGGFLIWQLPEYKIFVDGRMPAWPTPSGKSPYTIYLETLQTQPGWQETLAEYNINWILVSPGTFMDLLLKPDPEKFGWQEVFRDQVSVIYGR